MSVLYAGASEISPILNTTQNQKTFNILEYKQSDHILNDVRWLRADTNSWQSGSMYETAFMALTEYQEKGALSTDTINNITIEYYKAENGFKIALANQTEQIDNLYNSQGFADYFVLDADMVRFKLPRKSTRRVVKSQKATKENNYTWYNLYSDGYVEQGGIVNTIEDASVDVVFPVTMKDEHYYFNGNAIQALPLNTASLYLKTLAVRTNGVGVVGVANMGETTIYQATNWQWVATGYADESEYANLDVLYNYYYVGEFSQTAIMQTAGIVSERLNEIEDYIDDRVSEAVENASSLPSQEGNAGKYLTTDGIKTSWVALQVSGGGGDASITAGAPLLTSIWTDHLLTDAAWKRADTFEWHDGRIYTAAYNHLISEWNKVGDNPETDTIGDTTVYYRLASDGHKICTTSQEDAVEAIYESTGVAWYYIVDTINERFKLPRTKWGFTGYRDEAGGYVAAGLPNITGTFGSNGTWATSDDKLFTRASAGNESHGWDGSTTTRIQFTMDASKYNSIYGNSNTVQPPATQMYLYFFVGNFVQQSEEEINNLVGLVEEADSKAVHKSGTETISGSKTFTNTVKVKHSNININENPTASQYASGYVSYDINGNQLGYNQIIHHPDGRLIHQLGTYRGVNNNKIYSTLTTQIGVDGKSQIYVSHHPDATSGTNGTNVATIGWVNDATKSQNVVHRNSTETITGGKTFTTTIGRKLSKKYSETDTSVNGNNFSDTIATTVDSDNKALSTIYTQRVVDGLYTQNLYRTFNPITSKYVDIQSRIKDDNTSSVHVYCSAGVNNCLSKATNSTSENTIACQGWVNNPDKSTNVVHRTGNEIIAGNKTLKSSLRVQDTNKDIATTPTTNRYWGGVEFLDNNGVTTGFLRSNHYTTGNLITDIQTARKINGTMKYASIGVAISPDGTVITECPTPPNSSNGTQIASTGFVKSILSTSGNGLATFSKGSNGYYKFSNGLIIQWGRTGATGQARTVTFPTAFTTTNYTAHCLAMTTATQAYHAVAFDDSNKLTTGCTFRSSGNTESVGWNWFAIGY